MEFADSAGRGSGASFVSGILVGLVMAGLGWTALYVHSFGYFQNQGDRTLFGWFEVKRKAAQERRSRPKIVLLGGSNVLFGLRAERIERELGVPCVNYGTHAGMTLEFLIFQWRKVLRRGDLAVLSPEWHFLKRPANEFNDLTASYLPGGAPDFFWELDRWSQVRMILGAPASRLALPFIQGEAANRELKFFAVDWVRAYRINPFGDYLGNTPDAREPKALQKWLDGDVEDVVGRKEILGKGDDSPFWREIAKFVAWARKRKVRVVFAAPSVIAHRDLAGPAFREFFALQEAHYRHLGIPVVSSSADNFYPPELMLDSQYHLNSDGSALRTGKLIEALAPIVREQFGGKR